MIELHDVSLRSGSFELKHVSVTVERGQYVVLMGQTGCGKSTILEAICGLRAVTSGTIRLDGRDVTHADPADRGIGYVPQDLALFPTYTVSEHLAFALKLRRAPKLMINERIAELAELLSITSLLKRSVRRLSGGEAQRVAIGRALSFRPLVLLLDEPFSALDESTRGEMYALMKHVREKTGVTTLHVTHSQSEARALADRLLVLERGALKEIPNV